MAITGWMVLWRGSATWIRFSRTMFRSRLFLFTRNFSNSLLYTLYLGAGFYLNATQEPWNKNWKMYDYVAKELPQVIAANLPIVSIFYLYCFLHIVRLRQNIISSTDLSLSNYLSRIPRAPPLPDTLWQVFYSSISSPFVVINQSYADKIMCVS